MVGAVEAVRRRRCRGHPPNPGPGLALALAVFIQAAGVTGVVDGLVVGLIAGIGFVAVALASNHAFEGKSLKLYLINAGFSVVQYAVLGILLAAWQ